MAGGYKSELVKVFYARAIPRRFFSGLMTVNVINMTSDAKNDVNQEYFDHIGTGNAPPADAQLAWPFNNAGIASDPGRGTPSLNQGFGDYDTFLINVAGGMVLNAVTYQNALEHGEASPYPGLDGGTVDLSGYASQEGAWYRAEVGDWLHNRCQSYVKYDLISRMNNSFGCPSTWYKSADKRVRVYGDEGDTILAGGNAEISTVTTIADVAGAQDGTRFYIYTPETSYYVWYTNGTAVDPAISGMTGIQVTFVNNDTANQMASLTQAAIDAVGDIDASVLNNVVTTTNVSSGNVTDLADSGAAPTNFGFAVTTPGTDNRGEPGAYVDEVLNTGKFGVHESKDRTVADLTVFENNDWFNPVSKIEVIGSHRYSVTSQDHIAGGVDYGLLISATHTHDITFWSLVVKVYLRGYDSTSNLLLIGDKSFIQPRINVFFQPIGETAEFQFSESEHTS